MTDETNSRRSFFGRVTAAIGVVAAAVYTKNLISGQARTQDDTSEKYANDASLQEKAVMSNRLVAMTDAEKKQRLDDLLNFHNKEIS